MKPLICLLCGYNDFWFYSYFHMSMFFFMFPWSPSCAFTLWSWLSWFLEQFTWRLFEGKFVRGTTLCRWNLWHPLLAQSWEQHPESHVKFWSKGCKQAYLTMWERLPYSLGNKMVWKVSFAEQGLHFVGRFLSMYLAWASMKRQKRYYWHESWLILCWNSQLYLCILYCAML